MNEERTSGEVQDEPPPHHRWLERLGALLGLRIRVGRHPPLRELMGELEEHNTTDRQVLEMLRGVVDVAEMQARDIMVPRSQMAVLERDQTLAELLPVIIETAHSRFPVIGDSRDEVVGILLAKDLLSYLHEGDKKSFNIKDLLRPALIIPESKRLNSLLREFRVSHNHMAIVVDEYGGVSGLITIEDVLEQIVGEIEDEHDYEPDEDRNITPNPTGGFSVRALTPIDDFNSHFKSNLSDEEFSTIGGLVMSHFGRLPKKGEVLQLDEFTLTIEEADRRRIYRIRVERHAFELDQEHSSF